MKAVLVLSSLLMFTAGAGAQERSRTAQLSVTVTVIVPPTPEELQQHTRCVQVDPQHRLCTVEY